MKKFILFAVLVALLASCAQVVAPPQSTYAARVYNSAWQIVKEEPLAGKAITSTDALALEVAAYNAANTDDQWFLVEGAAIPIELAPDIDIYIVDRVTHEVVIQNLDWPRIQYEENIAGWRYDAACYGVLYIDNVPPPPPIIIDTRTDYEKYALYVVAPNGSIIFEDHCDGGLGGMSLEEYHYIRRRAFVTECQINAALGWYLIEGRLYP